MKHILNDLSNEEKNSIREQHTGGMKVMTENFSKLLNSKLGDSKPIVEQPSPKVQRAPQVSTPITKPTQSPQLIGMYDKSPQNFSGWKMCRSNSKGTLKIGNNDTWYMVDVTDLKNTALPSCMLGKLVNNYGKY